MDPTSFINGTDINEENQQLQRVSKLIIASIVLLNLLSLGCALTWQEVRQQLRHPYALIAGMLCQFVLLPLCMFALACALRLQDSRAMGMLVMATSPGGALSNVFTHSSDGDVQLSVCMTLVSTLTAMGMMPLNLLIYGRFWSSAGFSIPYSTMALGMLSFIIPVVVGMLIRRFLPKLAPYVTKFDGFITGPAIIVFVVLQFIINKSLFSVKWMAYFGSAFGALLRPIFGFVSGLVARVPWAQCRTVALETGCQNVPLAIALILVSFPEEFVTEAIFTPIVFGICSCVFSLVFVVSWVVYKRVTVKGAEYVKQLEVIAADHKISDFSEKE